MKQTIILMLALMIALTACSLSSEDTDDSAIQITEVAAVTDDPIETEEPAIETEEPQSEPSNSGNNNNQAGNSSNQSTACTPRQDWATFYTISSGDTLGSIARRTGTTTHTLADANCITNVNVITVGQQLRVPRVPTVPTIAPVPTATFSPPNSQQPPPVIGGVAPSESISGDAGFISVVRDSTVQLTWHDAPQAARASFFALLPEQKVEDVGDGTLLIGNDNNAADGFSVSWTIPASFGHQLVALAFDANGTVIATSYPLYAGSAPPAATSCRIRPIGDNVISYYAEPDPSSPIDGEFDATNAIPVLGRTLFGWYAISTHVAFSGAGGVESLSWVPVDAPVEIIPPPNGTVEMC